MEILSHADRNINLKSVLIGNGLTDAYNQYPQYPAMACGEGGHAAVLSSSTCSKMKAAIPSCQKALKQCYDTLDDNTCVSARSSCSAVEDPYYNRQDANPYDIRKACDPNSGGLCYSGMNDVQSYLNQQSVKDALGVEVQDFENCNNNVNSDFYQTGDGNKPQHLNVAKALNTIPVLVYAGDADYICNWLGNQAWTNALDWSGKSAFNSAETANLTHASDGSAYGTIKSAQGLAFSRIFDAGHLVPMDQPQSILDLVDRWIGGEWSKSK